jgi:hypothetical protein
MSKGNTFENDLMKLIYNATAIANLCDNAASAPITNISVALHTADPGEAGDQTTNEANYGAYARVSVARTSGGWTVTGNTASPVASITFPEATSGTNTLTHWSTGPTGGGATKIFHKGVIGSVQGAFTGATSDTITIPGHSLVVDDRIAFYPVEGSTLPTGITEGVVYWVKTVSGDAVTISTTQGGATLDITASGDGTSWRVTPILVTTGVTPLLSTSTTIKED